MCGPSHARFPLARQKVFFRSAPHASTGRTTAGASSSARGTYPRERRISNGSAATIVATESSTRVTMPRSWSRNKSAMSPSRRIASRVVEGNRLVRKISRRHHQWTPGVGQQQVVQRRIRQHQADVLIVRRNADGETRRRTPRDEDDRSLARRQQAALGIAEHGNRLRLRHGRDHHRKGFLITTLSRPQARHRLVRSCVTRQVETPDALERDDEPAPQVLCGARDGVLHREEIAVRPVRGQLRAARRAGHRLRVEPPIRDVLVFTAAVLAHLERRHRRRRPVVRDVGRNRQAGPAVGAVRERIPEPAIGRIEDFRDARVAGGQVGRNRDPAVWGSLAVDDDERGRPFGLDGRDMKVADAGGGWRGDVQRRLEAIERLMVPERIDSHASRIVEDPASDPSINRGAVDPGTEADPLDDSANPDPASLPGSCRHVRR